MDTKNLQEKINEYKMKLNELEFNLKKIEKTENDNDFYKCSDCKECCDELHYMTKLTDVTVNVDVDCEDEKLAKFIDEYIGAEIVELVEEAIELFCEDEYIDKDDDEDDECESQIKFELIYDKKNGTIVGVVMIGYCSECEERNVLHIFSNGNKNVEKMAKEMGYRES